MTLVDLKDFFEYTPGVLRLFVEPSHLRRIAKPLPSRRCRTLVAEVLDVAPSELTLRYPTGATGTLSFDYLMLACGSLYPSVDGKQVVKAGAEQSSLQAREATWAAAAEKLKTAEDAIVVGGGPVGVELAAEIAEVYPEKRVVLISRSERLCAALPHRVGDICARWLQKRNVEVRRGEATTAIGADYVTLEDGRTLRADVVYNCAGALPNSPMLRTHFSHALDEKGRLIVNDHLQVEGAKHIFGMGDLIVHRSEELKLGHTAELNAHVAVHNLIALHEGKPEQLVAYPEGAHGLSSSPQVFCVSLGKHAAALAFNGISVGGWLPAIMKWLLEWTKVAACEERPVGVLFWQFADFMTALISKYILPPPVVLKSTK